MTASTGDSGTDPTGTAVHALLTRTGRAPTHAALAPGRVNLIGEHTDYNEGFVLPLAIERSTVVVAARRDDRRISIRSGAVLDPVVIDLDRLPPPEAVVGFVAYAVGVLAVLQENGVDPGGFDADVASTVPLGGGLSSSAALEVALATLVADLAGRAVAPMTLARWCRRAENEWAGVPCGLMDQAVVATGRAERAMLLDCRSEEARPVSLAADEVGILVVESGVRHDLADGAYARRRAECRDAAQRLGVASLRDVDERTVAAGPLVDPLRRRARHVVTENARTLIAADALARRDWSEVGRLMSESHTSLRDDFEVSVPELDTLVAAALTQPGVFGARMTGGGFGGSIVALVDRTRAQSVAAAIAARYAAVCGRRATWFLTGAASGARPVPVRG